MALIKFNGMNKTYSVELTESINTPKYKRIKIKFKKEADILEASFFNGFVELNEHNLVVQADYSDMIYIYRKLDDGVTIILSNSEKDVYVEPIIPEPIPTPTPEPYVPSLDEVKSSRINELSTQCNSSIVSGFSVEIDGTMEHFSYDEYDQVNLKEIFDLSMKTQLPMYYHADGESCKEYSVEEIAKIYATGAMFKMHHITYFNQLKLYVNNMTDIEEVQLVIYGQELTGTYLETYQAAMEQAQNNINALLTQAAIEV